MAGTDASIDVEGPQGHAYAVWAAFDQHPRFLRGIESVERRGDVLTITGRVGARRRTWQARVVVEELDHRLAWRADDGPLDYDVTVEPLDGQERTRVRVRQRVHDAGRSTALLAALRVLAVWARGDLRRYKAMVEGGIAVGMQR